MNNYLKGISSLLTFINPEIMKIDIHKFQLDDNKALESDMKQIMSDFNIGLEHNIAELKNQLDTPEIREAYIRLQKTVETSLKFANIIKQVEKEIEDSIKKTEQISHDR